MIVNFEVLSGSKLLHSLKPFPELPVRVDIGIIKKTADLYAFSFQYLKRIGCAGPAADV
jgi:hypothetical protein